MVGGQTSTTFVRLTALAEREDARLGAALEE